jgi:hypothetical protein
VFAARKETSYIEILAQTEYQDLYRISDGVLLVINKFKYIDFSNKTTRFLRIYRRGLKKYNKGCQEQLKILDKDYFDEYDTITVKKGTILYENRPVSKTDNKEDWTYEVKTTGSSLGGNFDLVEGMLSSILKLIRTT